MANFTQNNFLQILQRVPDNSNPFIFQQNSNIIDNFQSDIPQEYIPKKEVRCPICLGRVIVGVRPNACFHVFCKSCLKKWAETKKICPYCRRHFSNIIKLDLTEDFIKFQGEYYAKY